MKALISKLSILTLVIFFAGTSYSYSKKDPGRTNSSNNPAGITYIVEVDASAVGSPCYTYLVSVKDENGNSVDGSIVYAEGISSYVFHENGPVSGTRSAHLEKFEQNLNCNNFFYTQPDNIQANFRNGSTYMFYLFPSSVPNNN